MIISHERRFILFPDPLGASAPLMRALTPWGDADIADGPSHRDDRPFFHGMTPTEAEWAFDATGLAFRSYLRISVVENPFSRIARLYDRIAQTDSMWQLRHLAGFGVPDFNHWQRHVRPDGTGAGSRNSPLWRQYGAWSAKTWEAGRITQTVRLEMLEEDILPILIELGIAPALDDVQKTLLEKDAWLHRYDGAAISRMSEKYAWDLAQFGYRAPRIRHAA